METVRMKITAIFVWWVCSSRGQRQSSLSWMEVATVFPEPWHAAQYGWHLLDFTIETLVTGCHWRSSSKLGAMACYPYSSVAIPVHILSRIEFQIATDVCRETPWKSRNIQLRAKSFSKTFMDETTVDKAQLFIYDTAYDIHICTAEIYRSPSAPCFIDNTFATVIFKPGNLPVRRDELFVFKRNVCDWSK